MTAHLPVRAAWTDLPDAARALDSCRRNPPRRDMRTADGNGAFPKYRRDDGRVRKLRQIYKAAEPPIDTPAWREWLALDVDKAIEAGESPQIMVIERFARACLGASFGPGATSLRSPEPVPVSALPGDAPSRKRRVA